MKKIFLTITILMVLLSSCERIDYNDINQNPYSPTEDNIDAMLLGGMLSYSQLGYRAGYSVASLYAQYQAQFAYSNEQLYNQFPGEWRTNYVDILSNLKVVANTTEDLRGSTVNMNAIAELMSVLVWKRVTDTFGDVPYFEALQGGNNITPAYTTQRDIYIDLISRVKDARDMIDSTQFVPNANTDIFYAGDMAKWGKFANSLLLSLTIQLSNTDLAPMAQTEFNNALNNIYGVMESNDDNMVFTPDLGGGNQNPISTQRSADYNLSKELTDSLTGVNGSWGPEYGDCKNVTSTAGNDPDSRLYRYCNPDNTTVGIPYGFASYSGGGADMNNTLDSEGSDYTLFNAAYTWLNRAEGALIYASG
ncbi:MAG TPA: SusD/RagB family nutrient-binding outer membrane lipoprotein, partial [Archaeoglobus profundus]|nr:SusD/RagB family nutrient-binding outer membrane lipoprotein [Archaeoglobus profundus]